MDALNFILFIDIPETEAVRSNILEIFSAKIYEQVSESTRLYLKYNNGKRGSIFLKFRADLT